MADIKRLASFPEQNPNPVVEMGFGGELVYSNPAARERFPDLKEKGWEHPLLAEVKKGMDSKKDFQCENVIGNSIFEQKIFFFNEDKVIRVYSNDVTHFKQIEKNLSRLASFPEQNPSPIIELDLYGNIIYFNPASLIHFPDFYSKKLDHAVLAPFKDEQERFRRGDITPISAELKIGQKYYHMRGRFMPETKMVRIFYHDITSQKETEEIIREKNKDITDSINYARRIQLAILPSPEILHDKFPGSFIFYQPKDIVSGDFYWYASVDEYFILACADCTGHGVPGALMSMMGSNLLTHIVTDSSINAPGPALSALDERLKRALKQEKGNNDSRDGMDIALCAIHTKKLVLHFAGANRPLIHFRGEEMTEYEPGKHAIGGPGGMAKTFGDAKIELRKGDRIYLFTDGITDQFGGPSGKKLMKKNFLKLLGEIRIAPIKEHEQKIREHFQQWKGKLNQLDDVLVIGIEI